MTDPIRSIQSAPVPPAWSRSARPAESERPPTESVRLGQGPTLLENLKATRATTPDSLSHHLTVEIPSSMIGGLNGYVVSLVSGQTVTLPSIRDASVVPGDERSLLKLSLDGPLQPSSQVLLTNGEQRVVPTMLALEQAPAAPPPPRPDLAGVLPMNPGRLEVPEDVLAALKHSKRVLVVCHTPPDGDTAGSGMGMRRALAELGKEADLFLDGPLPGWLRDQAQPGEFKSWDEVRSYGYDTVVVVDVAQSHRVGRARELVRNAPMAVFLDHHGVAPQQADWQRTGPTASWIAPSDATAVMVAAVVERLQPSDWSGITSPLVSGILTDTELFQRPVRAETGPILKHLLEARSGGNLEQACRRVEAHVADEAQGLLHQPMELKGELLGPQGLRLREAALAQKQGYSEELHDELALMVVPRHTQTLATLSGKLSDPGLNQADLQDVFYGRLSRFAGEKPLAVMLWEHPDHVHVSIRSQDEQEAIELARTLGGGGKPGVAAAHPKKPLAEVAEIVRQWGRKPTLP